MGKRTLIFILLICWVSTLMFPSKSLGRITIEITKPGATSVNIAIPDFFNIVTRSSSEPIGSKIREYLIDDLITSGYFEVIDKKAYIVSSSELWTQTNVDFRKWNLINADLLLKIGYTFKGTNIDIDLFLYDVYEGKAVLSKGINSNTSDIKYIAHVIADEIIRHLTGEESIFRTKVAFVSNQTGKKEIYVSDFDGRNIERVTDYNSITMFPRVSPDGNSLIFVSYMGRNGPQLYLKDLRKGTVRCLSEGTDGSSGGAWTPDGRYVVASLTVNKNQDLYLIDLEGKVIRRLTETSAIEVGPTVSPDGKSIAFVSDRGGSPQIYVMDISGGDAQRISFAGEYNSSPAWSKHNQIAYVSMVEREFDILVTDPQGNRTVKLTSGEGNDEDPTWAPNGRFIMFANNNKGRYKLYIKSLKGGLARKVLENEGDSTSPCWFR